MLWEGDAVQDLGTLPGHGASEALSINNLGDIVGSSGDPEDQHHAVLWGSGGGAIQNLGTLPDGTSSRALAMNDRGEVVGIAEASAGDHAFLWTEQGGIQDLNELLTLRFGFVLTHAVAISAEGVIVAIGVDEATSAEQEHDHDAHDLPLRIFRRSLPFGTKPSAINPLLFRGLLDPDPIGAPCSKRPACYALG